MCFTLLYQNRKCDDVCNTRVCGYDRGMCTMNQIITKCTAEEDAEGVDYSTKPDNGFLVRRGAKGQQATQSKGGTRRRISRRP